MPWTYKGYKFSYAVPASPKVYRRTLTAWMFVIFERSFTYLN